jgi:phosphoribosyl-AMP cyclohydrolase
MKMTSDMKKNEAKSIPVYPSRVQRREWIKEEKSDEKRYVLSFLRNCEVESAKELVLRA